MEKEMLLKFLKPAVGAILGFILLLSCTGYNTSGYRTVIESRLTGGQSVKFDPGFYFTLFGKTNEYPDVFTVNFTKEDAGSSVDIEPINIRFNDATSGKAEGVVKLNLPKDELSMIKIHKDYRSVTNLGITAFKPFVTECIKNSAQLMSSEMHYQGGRSTMSQYFQDQLESGVYILNTDERIILDSVEKENKRIYETTIEKDSKGNNVRKKSVLSQYKVTIIDAVISDVDYEERVDKMLGQKIDAQTKTSISKQKLMQAQQEGLTAEAEGKKKLVQIEYEEKQNQTKSVIQAQTIVETAKQAKLQAQIDYEASILQGKKIKELAEAEAYSKKAIMIADGALEKKLDALVKINAAYADALGKQPVVPYYYMGGGNGGVPSSTAMVDLLMAKTAKDLSLDMSSKK
jgi:hypothetical protein